MLFSEKSSLVKKQNELISICGEYIDLLETELHEIIPIVYNHGWHYNLANRGKEYRDKIEQLKNDIDWLQS